MFGIPYLPACPTRTFLIIKKQVDKALVLMLQTMHDRNGFIPVGDLSEKFKE